MSLVLPDVVEERGDAHAAPVHPWTVRIALWSALLVTQLRAWRWPNDWAQAHWLIGYELGLVKRGLPGTLLAPFVRAQENPVASERLIAAISTLLFVLFTATLAWIGARVLARHRFSASATLAMFVFVTSPYVVMSAHLNGYYDNLIILIAVIACACMMKNRVWAAVIAVFIGGFIHESVFVVGFPAAVLALVCRHRPGQAESARQNVRLRSIGYGLMMLAVPIFIHAALVLYHPLLVDTSAQEDVLREHLERYSFVENNRAAFVSKAFTTSVFTYFDEQSNLFFSRILSRVHVIQILPSLFVLLLVAAQSLSGSAGRRRLCALLAICILPLALHALAWDTGRIWAYPLILAMIGAWIVCETAARSECSVLTSRMYSATAVGIIGMNMFMHVPLMDNELDDLPAALRAGLYLPSLAVIALLVARTWRRAAARREA
jgi:hypothetical protein